MRRGVFAIALVAACGGGENTPAPDAGPDAPTGCSTETDCTSAAAPVCDPGTHLCVECRFDSHCSAMGEVCSANACIPAQSCAALHSALPTLPTASYTIDPDGAGGSAPIELVCDMTTDGGGWSVVFFPATTDLASTSIPYIESTGPLLASATDALLAYRGTSPAAAPNAARFAIPASWKTTPPFNVVGTDVTVDVSIDGGTPTSATLKYGYHNFSTLCTDPWLTDANYGRICIAGTPAPYFSRFVLGTPNLCSDSMSAYNAASCTADKRFTIAVR